jgi:hypothetical protein
VLSWGHGGHGQLGHSSIQNQKVPLLIEALSNEHVVYIACGGSSSAAITGKTTLDFFDSIFTYFHAFKPSMHGIYIKDTSKERGERRIKLIFKFYIKSITISKENCENQ